MKSEYLFSTGDVVTINRDDHKWYGYVLNEIPDDEGDINLILFYFCHNSNTIYTYLKLNEYLSCDVELDNITWDIEENIYVSPQTLELVSSVENKRVLAGVNFELEVIYNGCAYRDHVVVKKIISGLKYGAPDFLICRNEDNGRLIILTSDMVRKIEDVEESPVEKDTEEFERLNKALIIYFKYYRKQYKKFMLSEITVYDLLLWKISAKEKLIEYEMGGINLEEFKRFIQP